MKREVISAFVAAALIATGASWAHEDQHGKEAAGKQAPMVEKPFGRTGDAKKAARTIRVDMSDQMRFSPASISVKEGETVKFVVKNSGKVMHEFVLGTMQDLKQHSELMKKHPGMEHDEPYMAHVAPGKIETVVWQFTKTGEFHFGCLIPGHFEAGMVGKIAVGK
ncbi:MAG: cupredoxin family protein [Betaproteobacteria bacterium]